MFRLAAISLVLVFLLPAILSSLSGPSKAWAQADRTDLMQQSDHKRRTTNQTKPEPVEQQMAGVVPSEAGAGDEDYLVLGILVASVVILGFIATRGKRFSLRL